jgi:N-carbamoylputrescine amidase
MAVPRLRIALAQIAAVEGDLAGNLRLAGDAIRKAVRRGADLVCLPEAADLGWLHQEARADAGTIPGKYTDRLAGLASKHRVWICGGCLERDGERVYNSAVLIGPEGAIVLKHRKIKTLPKLTRRLYDAGPPGGVQVAETGFGRVGLTICADNFDLKIPRRAAESGAWLLLAPHGFAAPVKEMRNNAGEFLRHLRRVARGTGMWVAAANAVLGRVKGGAWKGWMHCGCSAVMRPDGTALATGLFKQADLVICDIPPDGAGSC